MILLMVLLCWTSWWCRSVRGGARSARKPPLHHSRARHLRRRPSPVMRQRRPRRRTEITALTVEGQVRFPTCILPPVSCRASKSPRTLQGIALWPTWLTRFLLLPEKSIVMRYWIFFSFEFNWIDQENVKFLPLYCFHLAFWETKKSAVWKYGLFIAATSRSSATTFEVA